MKQLSSAQIRQMFLDYFTEKGHRVEPSAPLVPKDDPTLLWINSGVATLKKYFDGSVIPDNPRIVNAQKSIRTNDIENVGYTARHHTFFEMLGNFSIGDYFKKEAIDFAWEFLTSEKWLGLQEELLTVTVHPEDDEAYDIWLDQMNLPKHRIIRLEENFWDIGVGPSGPNTEIFYDRGEAFGNDPNDPELYPGGENNRYLEVWNLVFSQFNHNPDDTYTPLPNKNIDTGMGLERVASIMQEVPSNYDTDLFMPIIMETEKLATKKYGVNKQDDTAFKVIADHIRTVAFAIGDHALPSNEGRGYVLRRLLRRAVRFAKQIGIEKPFMYKLVPTVGIIMHDYYPEVINQKDEIEKIIKIEEERFHETLYDGLAMLTSIIEKEKQKDRTVFPGVEVFKLYDTYGFPKELTEEYVAEQGFSIDEAGFESEMEKQRQRARSARQDVQSMDIQDEVLGSIHVESQFIGYNQLEVKTKIEAMIKDKQRVEAAHIGDEIIVFLHETPFYAESGGQINDQGWIETEQGVGEVIGVNKSPNGQHIHQVKVTSGQLNDQDLVNATVDRNKRNGIVKSHTATHLLHQALRDVLGDNVAQSGSLVTDNRLRFDFSHFGSISLDELNEIEQQVNEKIWRSIPVTITNQEIKAAKEMGAMALFGEKYGDIVRVVQIGDYSIELCGGCHVENTAEIGLFKILTETGIGAGTRRIEAVTSKGAYDQLTSKTDILNTSAELLNTNDEEVPQKIEALFQDLKQLKEQNESFSSQMANIEAQTIVQKVKKVAEINLLAEQVNVTDMNQLRNMVDDVKQKIGSGVFILAAESNEKVLLVVGVSKDLVDRGLHAGELIKRAAEQCGGGGGGRPDMAQAGGKDPEKIVAALNMAEKYIQEKIEQ
ncbi:MAG TPA: alanine--tRNA ligase [Virgibacillus sp.]|nr:alanine--tRNA ligase [Virgibacillus sp.]